MFKIFHLLYSWRFLKNTYMTPFKTRHGTFWSLQKKKGSYLFKSETFFSKVLFHRNFISCRINSSHFALGYKTLDLSKNLIFYRKKRCCILLLRVKISIFVRKHAVFVRFWIIYPFFDKWIIKSCKNILSV